METYKVFQPQKKPGYPLQSFFFSQAETNAKKKGFPLLSLLQGNYQYLIFENMKVAYLHGLDSNNSNLKNEWLKTFTELFEPNIDYREENIYSKIREEILNFNPTLIIGSSMGGYFAYELAKEFNIQAILFNPALHSRSYEPCMKNHNHGKHKPLIYCIFGKNDRIINPIKTKRILEDEGYSKENFKILNHAHDTPLDIFKYEISLFIEKVYD